MLGRLEEALAASHEAVAVYRELAVTRPEEFRPHLADALDTLAIGLISLGRREEALDPIQEIVTIRQELAVRRPDA